VQLQIGHFFNSSLKQQQQPAQKSKAKSIGFKSEGVVFATTLN
jgi:hypothetical protein